MKDVSEREGDGLQGVKPDIGGPRYEITQIRQEMDSRFDAMECLIIRGGAVLFVTLVVGFLSLVVSFLLTQG